MNDVDHGHFDENEINRRKTGLPLDIEVQTVKQLLDSNAQFLLIDCRDPEEHKFCRIEGARLIPLDEVPYCVDRLEPHRDQPIVVHCHHGGRSLQCVRWLRSLGYSTAQTMSGGIDAWSQRIDPSIPRY